MKRVVTVLLLALTPLAILAQSDDFDDGDDVGWMRYNPIGVGSWSFPNGGYRIQSAPSPNPGGIGPGRAGSLLSGFTYTNFYIYVDVTNWNDNVDQAFGLLARITDPRPGELKGYAFTYDRGTTATSGDMDISRITGEAPGDITLTIDQDDIHFVPGRTYRLVFIGIDATLEGLVYEHPNLTNAVARIVGTDATYPSGEAGLVVFDTSGTSPTDATFDNYFATNTPPPPPPPPRPALKIELLTYDTFKVSWPTNTAGFDLWVASDIAAPPENWTVIPPPYFIDEDNRFFYSDFMAGSSGLFFRLRRPPD